MRPEYYIISDELRDRLSEAVKPYKERISCDELVACITDVYSVDPPIENEYKEKNLSPKETARVIAFGISETIRKILQDSPEGRALMDEITNVYTGEGKDACVIKNMPAKGEAPFILLALQNLFGPGIKDIKPSISNIHFGGSHPHRDLRGTVPAILLHGMVVGKDETPTLIIDPEEVLDAAASIRCEELLKDKISCHRWEVRRELVDLLRGMRYPGGKALLSEHIFENGKKAKELTIDGYVPLQDYPYDISHLQFFNALHPSAMQSEVLRVIGAAIKQRKNYEGVVIQPDEMLILNNRLLLHGCGAEKEITGSSRQLLRAYLRGDMREGAYCDVNASRPYNLDLTSPEPHALRYAKHLGEAVRGKQRA